MLTAKKKHKPCLLYTSIVDIVLSGNLQQLSAVGCNQLLVGGNDMLSGLQCPLGKIEGGGQSTDRLDDDRNILIVQNNLKILGPFVGIGSSLQAADINDILDIQAASRLLLDSRTILVKNLRQDVYKRQL